jgi:hypothetical protein
VGGDGGAIDRVQRSSAHYFQRPDAPYLGYDPERTSMSGIKTGAEIRRRTGRHWLWAADTEYESPEFETNDMGRLTTADGPVIGGEIEYRETIPGSWYRDYSLQLRHERRWNYDGDVREGLVSSSAFLRWPNFWETEAAIAYTLRAQDDRLTRGGPLMQIPAGWLAEMEVENSDAARTRAQFSVRYGRDEDEGLEFAAETRLAVLPGSNWQLAAAPRYERQVETQQYVTTLPGGPQATFGSRYVFGALDRSTWATEFRLNYTFKPDLTLDVYAEPFAASGRYAGLGELSAARSRRLRVYGTGGTSALLLDDGSLQVQEGDDVFVLRNRDFNVVSFRSNVVLRWEWRAGSTLYLVWQQDRAAEETASTRASARDMLGSLTSRGDNFFAVKASFWFSPD